MRELYGMVMFGEKVLHTAHEFKTASRSFRRLLDYFDNPPVPEAAQPSVLCLPWERGRGNPSDEGWQFRAGVAIVRLRPRILRGCPGAR